MAWSASAAWSASVAILVASATGVPAAGQAAPGPAADGRFAPVLVALRAVREFNGDGRSFDLVLDVERRAAPADPAADEPRTVDDVRERLQPNTRAAAEARDRAREAAAAQAAARPLPPVRLALVDADGLVLSESAVVEPGRVDLGVVMPEIWTYREVAWLQPVAAGEPVGTPLVVQPMLGREVPVPEEAVSPAGIRYTRIRTWVGEEDAWDATVAALRGRPWPPRESLTAEGEVAATTGGGGSAGTVGSTADSGASASATDPSDPDAIDRVFTGFRIYPDALVSLDTEYGEIVIRLRPDAAPETAHNFRRLADGGFYRQSVFHRIVPMTPAGDPFVIQGGDPSGGGSGGPGWWLPMERSSLEHDFGVVSMARDVHPDSAGSQFFICLSRAGTARLDGSYTAFGEVIAGGDVVRRIAQVPLADAGTGRPREAPLIRDARLLPAPPRSILDPVEARDAAEDAAPRRSNRVPR